jgi:hypothetical protein
VARVAPTVVAAFLALGLGLDPELSPWGRPVAAVLLLFVLVHPFPGTTSAVLLRVGLPRAAAIVARMDGWNWGRDRYGGHSVMLALGLLRRPQDRILDKTLEVAQLAAGRITAGTVLAEGIRAFVRGEREDARRLWRLVPEFDRSVLPPLAARLAADLLAAEAAEQGELDRMLQELDRPRMARTHLGHLLYGCVRTLRGEPLPDGVLRGIWLASGTWATTLPLLDRVRAHAPVPPPAVPEVDDPLQAALIASCRLGEGREVRRASVLRAARAWEKALAGPVPPGIRDQVVTALAERLGHALDAPSAEEQTEHCLLFREIVWRCADRRDDHLRWLATELGQRADQRRALPLLEEVRAWCQLIEAFEQVIVISPERALSSFPRLYYPVVRHTVWLHNERKQATAANAMYRVELRFAELAGHDSGITLLRNNLACGV